MWDGLRVLINQVDCAKMREKNSEIGRGEENLKMRKWKISTEKLKNTNQK